MTSGADAATCADSGTPMLPPTAALSPPSVSMRPISVVVVDLPLVPVMATMRPASQRDASSSSPMTGTPAARAAATSACRGETPGLRTIRSALFSVSARWPPSSRTTPARRSSSAGSIVSRVSVRTTLAPRATSRCAAATPLRAAPTTTTRWPDTLKAEGVVIAASRWPGW